MQGSLNARPSLQCRATRSTQDRHLNARAFGWLDQDLLRELSSEKKPTPRCLFSEEAHFGSTLLFSRLPTEKKSSWRYLPFSEFPSKKPYLGILSLFPTLAEDDNVGQQEVGESGMGVVWLWSVGV